MNSSLFGESSTRSMTTSSSIFRDDERRWENKAFWNRVMIAIRFESNLRREYHSVPPEVMISSALLRPLTQLTAHVPTFHLKSLCLLQRVSRPIRANPHSVIYWASRQTRACLRYDTPTFRSPKSITPTLVEIGLHSKLFLERGPPLRHLLDKMPSTDVRRRVFGKRAGS